MPLPTPPLPFRSEVQLLIVASSKTWMPSPLFCCAMQFSKVIPPPIPWIPTPVEPVGVPLLLRLLEATQLIRVEPLETAMPQLVTPAPVFERAEQPLKVLREPP